MSSEVTLPLIWPVACHTNFVGKNSTFVAIKGQQEDGINYVPLALQKGARTIVAEYTAHIDQRILDSIKMAEAQLVFVPNARRSLALLAANAWQNPAQKLKIIALTGTKGKTTTAWLLHHILQKSGYKSALLSTVKNKIGDQEFPTQLTTQHPDYLHAFFHACVRAKTEYVIMEVAAQAASLHRIAGLEFDGLIFTNFAPAHGEFYATTQDYFDAKVAIINQCASHASLVINADDAKGAELAKNYPEATSFGSSSSGIRLLRFKADRNGIWACLEIEGVPHEFSCPSLLGLFNVYNSMAAITMALQLGISWDIIQNGLATFTGVPGRLEKYVLPNGAQCVIDYAHNPLAFRALLPELRSLTDHLIVVAGAGGDRDKAMRSELGYILSQYADQIILTSDNPRSENPADIIAAVYAGVPEDKKDIVTCEIDRQRAIQKAYSKSGPTSIIALLGKGPEQYQIIGTARIPFSERAIVQSLSLVF